MGHAQGLPALHGQKDRARQHLATVSPRMTAAKSSSQGYPFDDRVRHIPEDAFLPGMGHAQGSLPVRGQTDKSRQMPAILSPGVAPAESSTLGCRFNPRVRQMPATSSPSNQKGSG